MMKTPVYMLYNGNKYVNISQGLNSFFDFLLKFSNIYFQQKRINRRFRLIKKS